MDLANIFFTDRSFGLVLYSNFMWFLIFALSEIDLWWLAVCVRIFLSHLKVPQQCLGVGSVVFCKVLDLTCHFNSMTGYEIPCYSFDMLDPAFLHCLQDIGVPIKATLLWYCGMHKSTPRPFMWIAIKSQDWSLMILLFLHLQLLPWKVLVREKHYFVIIFWREWYNCFWLDPFIGPFPGLGILVFELHVKQLINQFRVRYDRWNEEVKAHFLQP